MKDDPAFWRSLRSELERLQNPRDHRTTAFLRSVGWFPREDGQFYSQWRPLAQRGGAVLSGKKGEDALEEWKEAMRARVPDSWHKQWNLETKHIPLSGIDVPADAFPRTSYVGVLDDHGLVTLVSRMLVELTPDGRYVAIEGGHLHAAARLKGDETILCTVRRECGLLHDLREGSIVLCQQLETEAVEAGIGTQLDPNCAADTPTAPPSDLISVKEAASICATDYDTFLTWIRKGVLPHFKVGPSKSLRVSRHNVEALVQPVPTVSPDSPDSRK